MLMILEGFLLLGSILFWAINNEIIICFHFGRERERECVCLCVCVCVFVCVCLQLSDLLIAYPTQWKQNITKLRLSNWKRIWRIIAFSSAN